jgi:Macrocin-O-methyltransferase (TylF)
MSLKYSEGHIYDQDGLRSIHNHEFMDDSAFCKAYARGVQAAEQDYLWHWRVHVGLWVAATASRLGGDFVECGVNRGFLSSAIMSYLDWDTLGKQFYLLDTFSGIDERFLSGEDRAAGALERNRTHLNTGFYVESIEVVKANFSEWKNVTLIEGPVPETLIRINAHKIAYLHLDMNCSPPEIAAAEFFWERLVAGACILLDDYGYNGYRSQKIAMDRFAAARQVGVLSLPTGQGLIIKPKEDV